MENEGEASERIFEDVVGYNGRKDECWKNGTPFARITKREPARSRDEVGTK